MERAQFEKLALEQLDAVYRLAFHLTRNAEEARDLVQEVYLKALKPEATESFSTRGGGMRAWLFAIAHNSFYTRVRREDLAPKAVGDLTSGPQPSVAPGDLGPAWDRSRFDWEQVDESLKSAIDDLSLEHREVLLMWGVDGLKYREIAEILEVPIGTVMSRLHRARKLIADRLLASVDTVDRIGLRQVRGIETERRA